MDFFAINDLDNLQFNCTASELVPYPTAKIYTNQVRCGAPRARHLCLCVLPHLLRLCLPA